MKHTKAIEYALECVAFEMFEECGSCSMYHPADFHGDCREDDYRVHPEDAALVWKAAPELLEALQKFVTLFEVASVEAPDIELPFPIAVRLCEAMTLGREAITKATEG